MRGSRPNPSGGSSQISGFEVWIRSCIWLPGPACEHALGRKQADESRVGNAFAFQVARDAPEVCRYRAGSPTEPMPLSDGWGFFVAVS
jgi:hypothetical protein